MVSISRAVASGVLVFVLSGLAFGQSIQPIQIVPFDGIRNIQDVDVADIGDVIGGQLTGACCVDGQCLGNVLQARCINQFCGDFLGTGSTCAGQACATMFGGVCCLNGTCDETLMEDECECAGGTYILSVGGCGTVICPGGELGACCVDGTCTDDVTKHACEVEQCGAWLGEDSVCTGLCPATLFGVCCTDGTCDDQVGADSCACGGGTWVTDATNCADFTCPEPTGRCCRGGNCTDLTQAECDDICGVWSGAGTTCVGSPLACFLEFGACCLGDTCSSGLGSFTCQCEGGTWFSAESCALSNATDCNSDGLIDVCAPGVDCNGNLVPDECDPDCNLNGQPDDCDITGGASLDCNVNGVPDECDLASGTSEDCNSNSIPDECETGNDCNGNQIPDECETGNDCNGNGVPDECELDPDCSQNFPLDCNFDGTLNECDPDCQPNGNSDICDLINETSVDCAGGGPGVGSAFFGQLLHNGNCQVCHGFGGFGNTAPNHRGYSRYYYQWKTSGCVFHVGGTFDFTDEEYANLEAWLSDLGGGGNGVPDECEGLSDCDSDGIADECVIAAGIEEDCNANSVPDSCDLSSMTSADCNTNGIPDECEGLPDCNNNGTPDECEGLPDCNGDGVPNVCDADCNSNGRSDICEILDGDEEDCDGNLIPDACEPDCNSNGIADACDIGSGTSPDVNDNGIPDECEPDCNGNGVPDEVDIAPFDVGKTVSVTVGSPSGDIPDCPGTGDAFVEIPIVADFGVDCASVEHVVVALDIDHTWVGDLVVELESPSGTVVTLLSRPSMVESQPYCGGSDCCGASNQGMVVELDDFHADSIETPPPGPFAIMGDYRPDAGATGWPGELAAFAGESECGTWLLRVHDGSELDAGVVQSVELRLELFALSEDCNGNGVPDECDVAGPTSGDCNNNGVPDECEDCNGNGIADICELQLGAGDDCNSNGLLDECEVFFDCNLNGILDECELVGPTESDCDGNGALDSCDLAGTAGMVVSGFGSANVLLYNLASDTFLGEFVAAGASDLGQPAGMAFLPNGDLLVGDTAALSIRRFDGVTGDYVGDFTTESIVFPIDLEISPHTGNVLALSGTGGAVFEFDGVTGAALGSFALIPGTTGSTFALSMTFGPDGDLYVSTFSSLDVLRFDGITGALIGPFLNDDTLLGPHGVTFGPNGNLFVADTISDNVREYDGTTGAFVGDFIPVISGQTGTLVFSPIGFGPDGGFYLGYSAANAVAYYDGDTGTLLEVYQNPGGALAFGMDLEFRPPSGDCDENGIPDQCEDCNANGAADVCDIADGVSSDVNGNGIPDECEGADIELALVVRASAGNSDVETQLPASDPSVGQGGAFVAELWGTDRGALNTGLEAVYADLTFDPAAVQVVGLQHRAPFFGNAGGTVDNVAGSVAGLGGTDAGASGVGVEPEWSRIAIVEFTTLACDDGTPMTLSAAADNVEAVGRGVIDPADIDYGMASMSIVSDCVYNLDGIDPINAGDFGMFAACWLTGPGDDGFDPNCDFDCSGFVDSGDFGWFAAVFGESCVSLDEEDYPPCRRCSSLAASSSVGGDVFVTWQLVTDDDGTDVELLVRDGQRGGGGVASVSAEMRLPVGLSAQVSVDPTFGTLSRESRDGEFICISGNTFGRDVGKDGWQVFATVHLETSRTLGQVKKQIALDRVEVVRHGAGWVASDKVHVVTAHDVDR